MVPRGEIIMTLLMQVSLHLRDGLRLLFFQARQETWKYAKIKKLFHKCLNRTILNGAIRLPSHHCWELDTCSTDRAGCIDWVVTSMLTCWCPEHRCAEVQPQSCWRGCQVLFILRVKKITKLILLSNVAVRSFIFKLDLKQIFFWSQFWSCSDTH